MLAVAEIDGVPTEIFPIADKLGVIVLDGNAELYARADGRTLRVVCASGRLTTSDPTNRRAMPTRLQNQAMPTMQASTHAAAVLPKSLAHCDDSEEALWSQRRTRFLTEKYKENFGNIGKKGGLSRGEKGTILSKLSEADKNMMKALIKISTLSGGDETAAQLIETIISEQAKMMALVMEQAQ
ncbi:hypothetical protein HPB52_021902 [Rhipicephalus sanguineus]|uniref:Uncharacterized protein n=1 Tax=Rhipicephalus sanguineus TaxID=34632 RepID=A0A9D4PYU4_RHISA|nr:hypothetical protein HPB52_021902 [Rhipicephalus sanguineus]